MKAAFWGVFAAGFVACSVFGIGPVLQRMGGNWLSAPMITGSVLGLVILAVGVLFGTGIRPGPLANDAVMLAVLAGLVGLKVLVATLASAAVR